MLLEQRGGKAMRGAGCCSCVPMRYPLTLALLPLPSCPWWSLAALPLARQHVLYPEAPLSLCTSVQQHPLLPNNSTRTWHSSVTPFWGPTSIGKLEISWWSFPREETCLPISGVTRLTALGRQPARLKDPCGALSSHRPYGHCVSKVTSSNWKEK